MAVFLRWKRSFDAETVLEEQLGIGFSLRNSYSAQLRTSDSATVSSMSTSLNTIPRHSMYAIYAYIDPPNHPNVGIYGIHGVSGIYKPVHSAEIESGCRGRQERMTFSLYKQLVNVHEHHTSCALCWAFLVQACMQKRACCFSSHKS